MKNIQGMTVEKHHMLSLGLLALCHRYVPDYLKMAIYEAVQSANQMGAPVNPENLIKGVALTENENN